MVPINHSMLIVRAELYEIAEEVRMRKAHVVEKYGGWEKFMKHMDEDRSRLEKEGWHFVTKEEVTVRKAGRNTKSSLTVAV